MNAFTYFLAIPFIYVLSALPLRMLYGISNFLYFFTFYVFKYRKGVVLSNLKSAFPNKNDEELNRLAKEFTRFLCDTIVETAKMLRMRRSDITKRCRFSKEALQIFEEIEAQNRSYIIVLGHHGNWEWAGLAMSMLTKHELQTIYLPLSNPYYDKLLLKLRSRFGAKLIQMPQAIRNMASSNGPVTATTFLADQAPPPDNAYWTQFLNQDTPVFQGAEKLAKKHDSPVIFADVVREKRGYYVIEAEILSNSPQGLKDGEITEKHTNMLEKKIIGQPETWLWSHRRWKHKRATPNQNAISFSN